MQSQPFHADKVHAAIASDAAAKSALVASWRRSANLHHLDPATRMGPVRLTQGELNDARRRIEPLLSAAQSSLDRLYQAVGGVGCCVLLADRDGIPIDRRGAASDDKTFQQWGLWTGTVWSEEAEGTNGIGTCLVEQRTLTIHADQHFFDRNTLLSCTTAPIYDHEGNLAAALDVSSCRADLTEGFVQLISMAVSDAARRIEADHFRLAFPDARILLAPTVDRGAGALLAVDGDDLVIGASRAARQCARAHRRKLEKTDPGSRSAWKRRTRRRRTTRCGAGGRPAGIGSGGRQCGGGRQAARHQPRDAASQTKPAGNEPSALVGTW